jgi:hypothetical protein
MVVSVVLILARSLVLTCYQIKASKIRFFNYDEEQHDMHNLIRDFLALVEDKVTSKGGRDLYKIVRQQNMMDDFAQAVNMGVCMLYHMYTSWPNVAESDRYRISQDVLDKMNPEHPDWDED